MNNAFKERIRYTMTISEMFENANCHKTVWSKRGDKLSKREVVTVASVRPRVNVVQVKESRKNEH